MTKQLASLGGAREHECGGGVYFSGSMEYEVYCYIGSFFFFCFWEGANFVLTTHRTTRK